MASGKKKSTERAPIHDFLYFDFAKAASILSQIEGGLVSERESSQDATKDERNVRKYDLKLFQPEFGGVATETHRVVEKRIAYHELFVRLDNALMSAGLINDVNLKVTRSIVEDGTFHNEIAAQSCIKASGWAAIEDYQRIQFIAQHFNAIAEFIGRCSLESNPELIQLQSHIQIARQEVDTNQNKTERSLRKKEIADLERVLSVAKQAIMSELKQADWLLEGISGFVGTLMSSRVNLSLYPLDDYLPFQIIGNLKRDCFVDAEVDNIMHAYGTSV